MNCNVCNELSYLGCLFKFAQNDHPNVLILITTEEKPCNWAICDTQFENNSQPNASIHTPTEEKDCKCDILCGDQFVERGSSVVECRTRNRVSPGSNSPLVPFGRLGIFLLSIDAPVDSAV